MEEAKNYIKQQLEAGASRETIEKSLEENGWAREDIQNAFASFDAPDAHGELQLAVEEKAQVSENEAREQNETETGEIKGFKSFLKLCYGTKTAWWSIILGMIIVFTVVVPVFLNSSVSDDGARLTSSFFSSFMVFTIVIGSLVVIRGTLWKIKKEKRVTFLKFLFLIITVVFYSTFSVFLYLELSTLILLLGFSNLSLVNVIFNHLFNLSFVFQIYSELLIPIGGTSLVIVLILLGLIHVLEIKRLGKTNNQPL